MKNEGLIIGAIVLGLIVGLIIGIFFVSSSEDIGETNSITKTALGIYPWNAENIQESRFNVELQNNGGDINDCTQYLRLNYENVGFWTNADNKYQCILYSVKKVYNDDADSVEDYSWLADCSCEYIKS